MASVTLMAFFSDKGVPKTGLSPTIDGYEDDGSQVIFSQAMTEVGGGWYKYVYATYDESKNYGFIADGTDTLNANDRYAFVSNEIGQVTEDITDIKGTGFVKDTDSLIDIRPNVDALFNVETGRWKIENNQMKFYHPDTGALLYTFNLFRLGEPNDQNVTDRVPV